MELEFTQDAVHTVASLAMKKKTGARGLRSILVSSIILVHTSSTCSLANHNFTDSSRNPVTSLNIFNITYGMVINTNACMAIIYTSACVITTVV